MIEFPTSPEEEKKERRQSQRIKFDENVQILNATLEDGSVFSTQVKAANISERGMMVLMTKPLKFGSKAYIGFRLPGPTGQRINCEIKVIWSIISEKEGFFNTGLQYLNLEPVKLTAIRTFIYGRSHAAGAAGQVPNP